MKNLQFTILFFLTLFTGFILSADENTFNWKTEYADNEIKATVIIPDNYYLYSEYTSVKLKDKNGNEIKTANSPIPESHTDEFGEKYSIYPEGTHSWTFTAPTPGTYEIKIEYQGCSKQPFACYPPQTIVQEISATSQKAATSEIEQTNKPTTFQIDKSIDKQISNIQNSYLEQLIQKGGIWIFIVALLGGLFSVFTPCVLPLLPITIAILGAGKDVKKAQAFKRSFFYVSGIIITFTSLAVFASLTGKAFGSALLSNPLILIIFALFFTLMSFSLLGLYDLQLPNSWNNALNKFGGGTDLGAFLMGLAAGFIAIPCTGPVLATLLGISAASGNIIFGSLLLFVYALGFGIPFFIVGIGLVKAPKSGAYMDLIKSFLGVIILILAIYIIAIAIPALNSFLSKASTTNKIIALILIISGVLFGAFHGDGHSIKKTVKYLKVLGAIFVAFGIVWILKLPVYVSENNLFWNTNPEQSFQTAEKNNKPLLMDFTAEWCAACKELEAVTFSDPEISRELKTRWILSKVDATRNSESLQKILTKYDIKGFPTVIFFSPQGKELGRFSGFIPPDKFLSLINQFHKK